MAESMMMEQEAVRQMQSCHHHAERLAGAALQHQRGLASVVQWPREEALERPGQWKELEISSCRDDAG